jgi:hypothetical protein
MTKPICPFKILTITILLLLCTTSKGGETGLRGKAYIFWGWNRGWFSNSNIRFEGDNYNFSLYNVQAHDRPRPFTFGINMNPLKMTIPQTNLRVGYFFSDHYSIAAGFDHMKYVMEQGQEVRINGEIHDGDSPFNGVYKDSTIALTRNFLQYEHTNGLNYIYAELSRYDRMLAFHKLKTIIYLTEGVATGFLMPRTAVRFLNHRLSDFFHVAGYGINLKAGLNIVICKALTLQGELKAGFINLPDVRTSDNKSDRAKQHFFFLEPDFMFGAVFGLGGKKKS